ncbi:hypothetical protein Hanom_Chr05g00457811 [Helianthus anomalus]
MYVLNCKRCHLTLKLIGFVLNVSKFCMLCSLGQTQLYFFVKVGHMPCTRGHFYHFASLGTIE